MTANPATIGDIVSLAPEDVRRRWSITKPYSYVPTFSEIKSMFPVYRDKYGKPSTVFDGVDIDGEFGDDEYVEKQSISFRRTVLDKIECSVSTPGSEIPVSGGSFSFRCVATFVWERNGSEDKSLDMDVTPVVECDSAEMDGGKISFSPNLTTKERAIDVTFKFGYKGRMLDETVCVRQKANGHNEWELMEVSDRSLSVECAKTDFGREGGMSEYKVMRKSSEIWVRRDYIGNIVEKEKRETASADVTDICRIYNPYKKRFSVEGGEIVCMPQRPNNTAVACHVKFSHDGLETTLRLTQECGAKTSDEAIFGIKGENGDTISLTDKDGSLETIVELDSQIVERMDDEVLSRRLNGNIRIIGKTEWVDARITNDGETVGVFVRTLSANSDRYSERKCVMTLINNEMFSKPLKISVTQPSCSPNGTRIASVARYPKEVFMGICEGEKVVIDVYEIKEYSDGTTERRIADPSRYNVKLETVSDGSMISLSEPKMAEYGSYESVMSFVSQNMNDYCDFKVAVVDRNDGKEVFVGKTESIHCNEIPVREIKPEKVDCVHLVDNKRKTVSDLGKRKKFVLKRGEDGRLTLVRK